jgi:hypothetical protein
MAVTVQDIFDLFCFDLWEDNGLQLGIVSFQQFIDALNLAILDFCREGCLGFLIYTMSVFAGEADYVVPDQLMRVDEAFLGGVLLEMSRSSSLFTGARNWRTQTGTPQRWHLDELPTKTVELAPLPDLDSNFVPGPNEPAPPHAQTGSWNIINDLGQVEEPDVHGALTLVGPTMPTPVAALNDPIPLVPDDFALAYLNFGVLKWIYSGDSELKDLTRAEWARAQFEEGVAILKAINGEQALEG